MEDYFLNQRLAERRHKAFGTYDSLYRCRFEEDNGLVRQLAEAKRYAQNWQEMRQHGLGLLLWGRPGNGKTYAAAAIANALIESREVFAPDVRMATFGTILTALLAKSPQEKEQYLGELIGCDLLILDDFGMERQTDYAREQIFHIIDGRYLSRSPLIVTTNLSLRELKNPVDLQQQRIFDRILEMCVPVCFDGESLRKDRAAENLRLYRQLTQRAAE